MLNLVNYRRKLSYLVRFFLTVFAYLVFGIGALVVSLFMILPVVAVSLRQRVRITRIRRINRLAFYIFIRFASTLGVFDVSFVGISRLQQSGQLIISNHPSLLDVVFLLGHIPNANCVVKKNLLKNPFLVIPVYFASYVLNDGEDALLPNCLASIKRGDSLIIFPEGTRTVKNQCYKFKRGAAHLMLMSNCPVQLVYISCTPHAMNKKTPWYAIPEKKITYRFTVMDELDLTPIRQADHYRLPLRSRQLTRSLVRRYEAMDLADMGSGPGR